MPLHSKPSDLEKLRRLGVKWDPCDEDILLGGSYYVRIYCRRNARINKKHITTFFHSIVISRMIGRELDKKTEFVDHINEDKLDNRRCNLRVVTRSQNGLVQTKARASTGFRGVNFHGKKYRAFVTINQKRIVIGTFNTLEGAKIARQMALNHYLPPELIRAFD